MTLEDQIAALLTEAEPLRALSEEQQAASRLGAIVDEINALRALQDKPKPAIKAPTPDMDPKAVALRREIEAMPAELPKRRPGRPRKEGADA